VSAAIGVAGAFFAGVLSFLSPCVLPLVPGYLSFITGYSYDQLQNNSRWDRVLAPSLLFVAGFTIVFVSLGATASTLGSMLLAYRDVLQVIAGALIFLLGVFLSGIIKFSSLYGEARFDPGKTRVFGPVSALITGMAFAFGWTPCVGPVLGSILALAGFGGSLTQGAMLLFAYSLGLGVPFIIVALLFGRVRGSLQLFTKYAVLINRISGALLMIIGVLIASDQLSVISAWFSSVLYFPLL